jgi:SAM-dependent methyltransferase
MRKALRFVPAHARVIDIGAHEGELFQALGPRLEEGFGVEPLSKAVKRTEKFVIEPGYFPAVRPTSVGWDAVTMLAVLEHIPRDQHTALAAACYDLLKPGGRVIITVPSAAVDYILAGLRFFRLIDGMSLEEHYGFEPDDTPQIFAEPKFRLMNRMRFQAGLNTLFVFEKR